MPEASAAPGAAFGAARTTLLAAAAGVLLAGPLRAGWQARRRVDWHDPEPVACGTLGVYLALSPRARLVLLGAAGTTLLFTGRRANHAVLAAQGRPALRPAAAE